MQRLDATDLNASHQCSRSVNVSEKKTYLRILKVIKIRLLLRILLLSCLVLLLFPGLNVFTPLLITVVDGTNPFVKLVRDAQQEVLQTGVGVCVYNGERT
jgi:hypothetical protein